MDHSKIGQNVQKCPYASGPHTCIASILSTSSAPKAPTDETTMTHHNHQGPWFTLWFTCDVVHFVALEKCMMTCVYYDSVIQSSPTAVLCLVTPLFPTNAGKPSSFHLLHSFVTFPECHIVGITVCSLFQLASFTK